MAKSSPATGEGKCSRPVTPLTGFLLLYALMYSAFGASSPFLPSWVEARGISPEYIGTLFAAGTAIRLVSAPIAGQLADRFRALRLTLAICAIGTAAAVLGYLPAWGFWSILMVSVLHSFAVAPTTNLADALALVASKRGGQQSFEYGWVRGAGSAAFIVGSVIAGLAIETHGLSIIIWLQASLMAGAALAVRLVPPVTTPTSKTDRTISQENVFALLRLPVFRRVVLVAALILGSHAMHDTFAVIRWTSAGISAQTASMLWSLSVGAEVAVFFLIGPKLLRILTPSGAIMLAGFAGAVRWFVAAFTANVGILFVTQPLHGITFALLHLACMRLLANNVPQQLAATAQAIYGTVGVGAATALLTLLSGWLYTGMGPMAFTAMSLLCLAAILVAVGLKRASSGDGGQADDLTG